VRFTASNIHLSLSTTILHLRTTDPWLARLVGHPNDSKIADSRQSMLPMFVSRGPRSPDETGSRCKFAPEEDARLRSLVDALGVKNWDQIACFMGGRTPRQCRDRFNNYLLDSLQNTPWTPEDDAILIEQYHLIGPKWVEIGKMLHGRSGNNVKNRWHKHIKKSQGAADEFSPTDSPETAPPDLPTIIEAPAAHSGETPVGISDNHWEQILASLEKDVPFDSLWANAFSVGETQL
jgi:hypothetical protein